MAKKKFTYQSKFFNIAEAVETDGKKSAEILIDGVIGGWCWWDDVAEDSVLTKQRMRDELKAISALDVDVINVKIDSLGGDVGHAVSMHDMLKQHKAEIHVDIIGLCASAATIVAQAADKGKLRISDNVMFLIHCATTWNAGNKFTFQSTANDLVKFDTRISNIYAKRSGKTAEDFLPVMEKNNGVGEWMSAVEAMDAGLVDASYEPIKAAAFRLDKVMMSHIGLPSLPDNEAGQTGNQTPANKMTKEDKKTAVINSIIAKSFKNLTEEEKTMVSEAKKFLQDGVDKLTELEGAGTPGAGEGDNATSNDFTAKKGDTLKDDKGNPIANKTITNKAGEKYTTNDKGVIVDIVPKEGTATPVVEAQAAPVETPKEKELRIKNEQLTAELVKVTQNSATEVIVKTNDPSHDGGKGLTKNQAAQDANAKSLRGRE